MLQFAVVGPYGPSIPQDVKSAAVLTGPMIFDQAREVPAAFVAITCATTKRASCKKVKFSEVPVSPTTAVHEDKFACAQENH